MRSLITMTSMSRYVSEGICSLRNTLTHHSMSRVCSSRFIGCSRLINRARGVYNPKSRLTSSYIAIYKYTHIFEVEKKGNRALLTIMPLYVRQIQYLNFPSCENLLILPEALGLDTSCYKQPFRKNDRDQTSTFTTVPPSVVQKQAIKLLTSNLNVCKYTSIPFWFLVWLVYGVNACMSLSPFSLETERIYLRGPKSLLSLIWSTYVHLYSGAGTVPDFPGFTIEVRVQLYEIMTCFWSLRSYARVCFSNHTAYKLI